MKRLLIKIYISTIIIVFAFNLAEANSDEAKYKKSLIIYYKGLKEYEEARYNASKTNLNKALELNKNLTFANFILGKIYFYENNYQLAINEFNKYIDNPFEEKWVVHSYINISICYRYLKQYDRAQETLNKVSSSYSLNKNYIIENIRINIDKLKYKKIPTIDIKIEDSELFKLSSKYPNDYGLQNAIGLFFLYKGIFFVDKSKFETAEKYIGYSLDFFYKTIKLKNKFVYIKNLHSSYFHKGEIFRELAWMQVRKLEKESSKSLLIKIINSFEKTKQYYLRAIRAFELLKDKSKHKKEIDEIKLKIQNLISNKHDGKGIDEYINIYQHRLSH